MLGIGCGVVGTVQDLERILRGPIREPSCALPGYVPHGAPNPDSIVAKAIDGIDLALWNFGEAKQKFLPDHVN